MPVEATTGTADVLECGWPIGINAEPEQRQLFLHTVGILDKDRARRRGKTREESRRLGKNKSHPPSSFARPSSSTSSASASENRWRFCIMRLSRDVCVCAGVCLCVCVCYPPNESESFLLQTNCRPAPFPRLVSHYWARRPPAMKMRGGVCCHIIGSNYEGMVV